MADKKFDKQIPNNVVAIGSSTTCCAEGCKKKSERAEFCAEHFEWFKAGLVTRQGARCSDFDKKFYHFSAKKAA